MYTKKRRTSIDSTYYSYIIEGMKDAATRGTAASVAIPGIEICGKTGTAQNPPFPDHSIFMCFAPKENPKIAMLVFIENGGFGATWGGANG